MPRNLMKCPRCSWNCCEELKTYLFCPNCNYTEDRFQKRKISLSDFVANLTTITTKKFNQLFPPTHRLILGLN